MLADKLRAASLTALPLPEFVSSSSVVATATSIPVTAPTGIQNGDLLVAFISVNRDAGTTPLSTWPPGFNIISSVSSPDVTLYTAIKVASSESGNYTFTFSGIELVNISILVYRNATTINCIGVPAAAGTSTGTAASITPSYEGVLCGVFFSLKDTITITTPPSGMTQRSFRPGAGPAEDLSSAIYDLNPQAPSATGDKTIVWSASNSTMSVLFQITNEPDVAPDFIASASAQRAGSYTTLVINKPTGTVEGDLMVAVMGTDGGTSTLWTGDTDWNEIADQGSKPSLRIAYKVAGASEAASYTFTTANADDLGGSIVTYRYAAYDTVGAFTTATDPLILPSVTTAESQCIVIATGLCAASGRNLGTPAGMTARVTDNDAVNGPSYIICDQTVAKGATGIRSMSVGTATNVAGIMLSIKPTRSL